MNRGDLEAAVALYEPNAILVADSSGETLTGQAAIREAIRSLLALGLQMTRETRGAFVEAGVRYQGVRLRVHTVRTLRPRWVRPRWVRPFAGAYSAGRLWLKLLSASWTAR